LRFASKVNKAAGALLGTIRIGVAAEAALTGDPTVPVRLWIGRALYFFAFRRQVDGMDWIEFIWMMVIAGVVALAGAEAFMICARALAWF
jgi:hypothetical protein